MSSEVPTGHEADVLHCYRHPDRETLVRCSNCDRPICPSCMTPAAVGIRCPECSGGRGGTTRVRRIAAPQTDTAAVTVGLIVVNCIVFAGEVFQGVGVSGITGSRIVNDGAVWAAPVADGEVWRLVTSGFIHASFFHILFNMWALWVLGGALESWIGPRRLMIIFASSVLWGSAGAILLSPDSPTVGASGGVFGLMGALLVMSRQRGMDFMSSGIGVVLLLNLGITFAIPGISIGGHLGGLAGGVAAALVLSGFGRGHLAYGRWTPPIVIGSAVLVAGAVATAIIAAHAAVG
ncbi:MAG: rhomboid family intramembrane serine protease [Thermoleophilia bacterium]